MTAFHDSQSRWPRLLCGALFLLYSAHALLGALVIESQRRQEEGFMFQFAGLEVKPVAYVVTHLCLLAFAIGLGLTGMRNRTRKTPGHASLPTQES